MLQCILCCVSGTKEMREKLENILRWNGIIKETLICHGQVAVLLLFQLSEMLEFLAICHESYVHEF